jgi:N-methylhydantoinase A
MPRGEVALQPCLANWLRRPPNQPTHQPTRNFLPLLVTHETSAFRIAADIGGTFTDIALLTRDGRLSSAKLLSTPANYADAVIDGVVSLMRRQGLDIRDIVEVLHGCTVATNAILERKGARTALVTTHGFRDVLELRRVRVPRLYAPLWRKPPPLVPRQLRFEVMERIDADGSIVRPLEEPSLDEVIAALREARVEAVAVCLINAFANPTHEQRIGERLRAELPGCFISLSTEILPQIREYERTSTTVVNAYVGPPVKSYLSAMIERLASSGVRGRLLVMQSSGGVLSADAVLDRPAQIVECGPAAGVIGARHLGRQLGYDNVITFDMGGTTAKASLIERGRLSTSEQYEVGASMSATSPLMGGAGYALKLPVIDVSEVGAGGGSIVRIDSGGAIKVGPESAGAVPGPACYGRGGTEPTIADANVVLGYLNPKALAGGSVPIDAEAAHTVIRRVATPLGRELVETAYGIHLVANTNMMRTLKAVSTNRGRDTRDFVMFAFGGLGGVHAASLARELRIGRIVVPPAAGVFSALGLLFADLELNECRACLRGLDALSPQEMEQVYGSLAAVIARRLGRAAGEIRYQRLADMRYAGQAFEISVALPDGTFDDTARKKLASRFDAEHERRYGHCFAGQYAHEVVNLRLIGSLTPDGARRISSLDSSTSCIDSERMAYFGPAWGMLTMPVMARGGLSETPRRGPLIIEEYEGTVVVPPDATAARDAHGDILIDLSAGE